MPDLLLLSGGIDSSAIAHWIRPAICLTINYGQLAAQAEITASRKICEELQLKHLVKNALINEFGSGDMADLKSSLHSGHSEFWPFRNQFLISLAGMVAMQHGCNRIVIGTVATDIRHMDGTSQFLTLMNQLLSMQEGELTLHAPALTMTTRELVQESGISKGILGWSHSCHTGIYACGDCRGCSKHSELTEALYI